MNPFAAFQLEPSPAPDLEALKQEFNRATAATHPDKFPLGPERAEAESRYSELNRAYQTLMDPRQRLLALYELTQGGRPPEVQRIPPGTMDLFMEVGQTCRNLDGFLQRKRNASGALARADLMGEELELQEALLHLRGQLEKFGDSLQADLIQLEQTWRKGERPAPLLETLYRKFSYLARWRQQVEEREIALLTEET